MNLNRCLTLLAAGIFTMALTMAAWAEDITVEVQDGAVVNEVGQDFHGSNFCGLWNNVGNSPSAKMAFAQSGMKVLRYPGGVPAQWYNWSDPLATGWDNVVTHEQAWDMVKPVGGQLLLQTNAATDKTDTDKKTGKEYKFDSSGAHQAEWVAWAKKNNYTIQAWEIGNEPEMDAPAPDKKSQDSIYKWYNAKYTEQVQAIRKVDPKARVMGPAATNEYFWWGTGNLKKFLDAHGNVKGDGLADMISLHWYPEGGKGKWDKTAATAQHWLKCWEYISKTIKECDNRDLPVYITEWNWGGGMDNASCTWLATALGNADMIGMFQRTGVKGEHHFCLQGGGKSWGILDMKSGGGDSAPWPSYFSLSMVSKLTGKVFAVKNPVDEGKVLSAYAALDAAGQMHVMLINKTAEEKTVTVKFQKFAQKGQDASLCTLWGSKGTDVYDTKIIYNGVNSPQPQKEPLPKPAVTKIAENFSTKLPPYSMAVVSIGKASAVKTTATTASKPAQ